MELMEWFLGILRFRCPTALSALAFWTLVPGPCLHMMLSVQTTVFWDNLYLDLGSWILLGPEMVIFKRLPRVVQNGCYHVKYIP